MANILMAYATTDGHTRDICLRLQETINENGHTVSLVNIKDDPMLDIKPFDKVVIGASIRYGKHNKLVYEFIKRNEQMLNNKPNAFFSVNVVARKPEKNRPETNPYLIKFLKQITWKPNTLEVFAGRLDYPKYTYFDRMMIRFIMWMTKGPTAPDTVVEYTNWQQVASFGKLISNM